MLPLVPYHVLHVVEVRHMPHKVQEIVTLVLEVNIKNMQAAYTYVLNVVLDSMVRVAIIAIPALTRLKLISLVHLALLENQARVMVQLHLIIVLIVKPALIPN